MAVVPPWCEAMASRNNLRQMITQAHADTSAIEDGQPLQARGLGRPGRACAERGNEHSSSQ